MYKQQTKSMGGGGGSLKNGLGLEDWCLSWGLCQSVEWSISTVKV
jgi:hypothetical protein